MCRYQKNKFTWSIFSLLNKQACLNMNCVFVRLVVLSKALFPCEESYAALFYVTHSFSLGTNMSLYIIRMIRKRANFSFSGNNFLQAHILYVEKYN